MKPTVFSKYYLIFILSIWFTYSLAQDNCVVSLKKAEKLYDEGKLDEIPPLLKTCIKEGFTKDQAIRAYELIILSYLVEDMEIDADEYMLKLLKLEPNYTIRNRVVTADFIALYKTIQTQPVFSMGIVGGINTAQIAVIEEYGLHNINETSGSYSSNLGFHIGITLQKSIAKNLESNLEFLYTRNSFEYNLNNAFEFTTISYSENQNHLNIPLSFTYQFNVNGFSPYVRLGCNLGLMINADIQATRIYTDNSHADISSSVIDISNRRENLNYMLIFGMGLKYQIERGYVFIDARYNKGLKNQAIPSERYSDEEMMYKYYIIDDDFYFNSIKISIGYTYSFYRPQKKK